MKARLLPGEAGAGVFGQKPADEVARVVADQRPRLLGKIQRLSHHRVEHLLALVFWGAGGRGWRGVFVFVFLTKRRRAAFG